MPVVRLQYALKYTVSCNDSRLVDEVPCLFVIQSSTETWQNRRSLTIDELNVSRCNQTNNLPILTVNVLLNAKQRLFSQWELQPSTILSRRLYVVIQKALFWTSILSVYTHSSTFVEKPVIDSCHLRQLWHTAIGGKHPQHLTTVTTRRFNAPCDMIQDCHVDIRLQAINGGIIRWKLYGSPFKYRHRYKSAWIEWTWR